VEADVVEAVVVVRHGCCRRSGLQRLGIDRHHAPIAVAGERDRKAAREALLGRRRTHAATGRAAANGRGLREVALRNIAEAVARATRRRREIPQGCRRAQSTEQRHVAVIDALGA
jgi:hypothetical protein